ncbi:MAG: hypothetical protein QOE44_1411, partial [Solirubrobacteraceae bacterium]|nr:hypothetical protein [Solirubrobacteraceae bacterium]
RLHRPGLAGLGHVRLGLRQGLQAEFGEHIVGSTRTSVAQILVSGGHVGPRRREHQILKIVGMGFASVGREILI